MIRKPTLVGIFMFIVKKISCSAERSIKSFITSEIVLLILAVLQSQGTLTGEVIMFFCFPVFKKVLALKKMYLLPVKQILSFQGSPHF